MTNTQVDIIYDLISHRDETERFKIIEELIKNLGTQLLILNQNFLITKSKRI